MAWITVSCMFLCYFFFSSRRRHTRCYRDWSSDVCSSDLDLLQELHVALGLAHLVDQQLQRRRPVEGVQHPPQLPDEGQLFLAQQELLLAGPRGLDVDGREDPLLRRPPVEPELPVAGALELLEDHLVHPGA